MSLRNHSFPTDVTNSVASNTDTTTPATSSATEMAIAAAGISTAVTETVVLSFLAAEDLDVVKPDGFMALGVFASLQAATMLFSNDKILKKAGWVPGAAAGIALLLVDTAKIGEIALQPIAFSVAVTAGFAVNFLRVYYNNDAQKTLMDKASIAISGVKMASILSLIYNSKLPGDNIAASEAKTLSGIPLVSAWAAAGSAIAETALGLFSATKALVKNCKKLRANGGLSEELLSPNSDLEASTGPINRPTRSS